MSRYLPALAEYRTKYQTSAPEVLLQLSDDGGPAPFRLYRMDLVSGAVNTPNLTEVNLESVPDFPVEHIELPPGVTVHIEPFHWNGAEFTVRRPLLDATPIADWCNRWIDVSESNPQDEHGLLGAIHSVTAPELRGDATFFSVDFGSAPVAAAEGLLDLLGNLGATDVHISSSWVRT
jgi:hypothetical protein